MRLGDKMSPPRLNNIVDKLRADNSYTVLAHKAWEQNLGEQPVKIAITDGEEQFGQFPIEGTLNLQLGRFTDIDAQFWINQFDSKGSVIASEHLNQTDVRTKNNQLNYLDGGHLALLIKITSLTAKPPQRTTARHSGLIQRHAPDIVADQTPGPFVGQSLQRAEPGARATLRAGEPGAHRRIR